MTSAIRSRRRASSGAVRARNASISDTSRSLKPIVTISRGSSRPWPVTTRVGTPKPPWRSHAARKSSSVRPSRSRRVSTEMIMAARPYRAVRSRGPRRARRVELRLLAAELGDRLVAEDPLARDPVPVALRAQLGHDREREHLQAPPEEVVGGQRLVAHLPEVARARVGHLDDDVGRDLGLELELLVSRVPPGQVVELGEDALFVVVGGIAHPPPLVEVLDQPAPVPQNAQALGLQLELRDLGRDSLEEPEVEEDHARVVEEDRVARVRVAAELVVAVHAPEVEAEDDLADAVALRLRQLLDLLEA